MGKNQENELMMNEISVKSLQEISGGAIISFPPITSGIISRPTGIIAMPLPRPIPRPTTGIVAPTFPKY